MIFLQSNREENNKNIFSIGNVKLDVFKIALLIVSFLVLALVGFVMMDSPKKTYSFLTIDINPSIKLNLDESNTVISSIAMNEDGKKILEKIQLNKQSAQSAVNIIVSQSVTQKYLRADQKDHVIMIGAFGSKTGDMNKLLTQIKASIQQNLATTGITVLVETAILTDDLIKEAEQKGVSPGKLLKDRLPVSDNTKINNGKDNANKIPNTTFQSIPVNGIENSTQQSIAIIFAPNQKINLLAAQSKVYESTSSITNIMATPNNPGTNYQSIDLKVPYYTSYPVNRIMEAEQTDNSHILLVTPKPDSSVFQVPTSKQSIPVPSFYPIQTPSIFSTPVFACDLSNTFVQNTYNPVPASSPAINEPTPCPKINTPSIQNTSSSPAPVVSNSITACPTYAPAYPSAYIPACVPTSTPKDMKQQATSPSPNVTAPIGSKPACTPYSSTNNMAPTKTFAPVNHTTPSKTAAPIEKTPSVSKPKPAPTASTSTTTNNHQSSKSNSSGYNPSGSYSPGSSRSGSSSSPHADSSNSSNKTYNKSKDSYTHR